MISSILKKIKSYDLLVRMGRIKCRYKNCPKCSEKVENFKRHDSKKRIFFVIEDELVKKIETLLLRWKCPLCKKTFMDYPSFALPYKNYIKQDVLRLAERYITRPETSYESCASHENGIILHKEKRDNKLDKNKPLHATFEKSTIHRWISSLAQLKNALQAILQLIREKSPTSQIFREFEPIFRKKYRSEKRRIVLETVQKILRTNFEFEKIFAISIFPQFATPYWKD